MTLLRMLAFRPGDAPEVRGAAASVSPAVEPRAPAPERAAHPPPPGNEAALSWSAILNQLDLSGAARQLASHCVLLLSLIHI